MQPFRAAWQVPAFIAAALVVVTRWPFRSHYLFSWDSANYAFALERIDIAAHRPHPPGYLGYIIAARALNALAHDPNAALVGWNVIATAIAAIVIVRFASEAAMERHPVMPIAAAAIVISSPLLWFYGEVAEIYASELLFAVLVGFCAWRVVNGRTRAIHACAVFVVLAAVFKLTTAVLMLPAVLYAWWQVPPRDRARSAALFALLAAATATLFLSLQPDLLRIVREQFFSATAGSRALFKPERPSLLRTVNRGVRGTLQAGIMALGPLNALACFWWLVRDRRAAPLGLPVALLWTVPALAVFVLIHIAKPGYVLILLPVPALILARVYSGLKPSRFALLVGAQAAANAACFLLVQPFPDSLTGGGVRYSAKTALQRAVSDLQGITTATLFTIRQSDAAVARLVAHVQRECPHGDPVVIASGDPVDWRRAMWYLPGATAFQAGNARLALVARDGAYEFVPDAGVTVVTRCRVLWLAKDAASSGFPLPPDAMPVEGLGFALPAGEIRIAPTKVAR